MRRSGLFLGLVLLASPALRAAGVQLAPGARGVSGAAPSAAAVVSAAVPKLLPALVPALAPAPVAGPALSPVSAPLAPALIAPSPLLPLRSAPEAAPLFDSVPPAPDGPAELASAAGKTVAPAVAGETASPTGSLESALGSCRRLFDGEGGRGEAVAAPDAGAPGLGGRVAETLRSFLEARRRPGGVPKPKRKDPPDSDEKPFAFPKPGRWLALAGLLALLSWAPPAAQALTGAPFTPLNFGLGLVSSWTHLGGLALLLLAAGLPLRYFAHRLAPWMMKGAADPTGALKSRPWLILLPELLLGAALEEIAFRGLLFPFAAAFVLSSVGPSAALAVGAFASAFVFAVAHRYGPVWTRVVGALLYTTALLGSGTLLLPIAAHFAYNLYCILRARQT